MARRLSLDIAQRTGNLAAGNRQDTTEPVGTISTRGNFPTGEVRG
jgi:hypothetical protein